MRRASAFYSMGLLIPTTLFTLLSFSVFYMSFEVGERVRTLWMHHDRRCVNMSCSRASVRLAAVGFCVQTSLSLSLSL